MVSIYIFFLNSNIPKIVTKYFTLNSLRRLAMAAEAAEKILMIPPPLIVKIFTRRKMTWKSFVKNGRKN